MKYVLTSTAQISNLNTRQTNCSGVTMALEKMLVMRTGLKGILSFNNSYKVQRNLIQHLSCSIPISILILG